METNSAQAPTRNDVAAVHASMPGCGLAAYMTVLLVVMTFGGTMALMSGLTIVASSEAARPTRLMYGGDVEPYLYNGMRAAKLRLWWRESLVMTSCWQMGTCTFVCFSLPVPSASEYSE